MPDACGCKGGPDPAYVKFDDAVRDARGAGEKFENLGGAADFRIGGRGNMAEAQKNAADISGRNFLPQGKGKLDERATRPRSEGYFQK